MKKILCTFIIMMTIFISQISLAEEHEAIIIKTQYKNQSSMMVCQTSQIINPDTKFIIADDDVNNDLDLTSSILSQREPSNYSCRQGDINAAIMKIDGQFLFIMKKGESFYKAISDSLDDGFELEKVDSNPEIICGDQPENPEDKDENLSLEEDSEAEIGNKSFELNEEVVSESRYEIFFDGIIDQYFFRDYTDENLEDNERFMQAIDIIERNLLIINVVSGSEIRTTFKLKKLYAYFRGNRFHRNLSINSILGEDIWDSLEGFFEGRPQSTRAFANLFSSISRGGANGTANRSWHPICSPGLMWSRIEAADPIDIDQIRNDGNFNMINHDQNLFISNAVNFVHEFNHLNGMKHNLEYRPHRDCCSLARRIGVPFPEELDENYRAVPQERDSLRLCMDKNFGSKRNDWNWVDEPYLYSKVYSRPAMSSNDPDLGASACRGGFLPVMSDKNRDRHFWKMGVLSRRQIDGGNTLCVTENRNNLPIIRGINTDYQEIDNDTTEYVIFIDAEDPDRGNFQIRGAEGLVDDRQGIMAYEVRKLWPVNNDPEEVNFITSLEPEITINLNHGYNIIEVRVYDYSGSFTSQKVQLLNGNFLALLSQDIQNGVEIDQTVNMSVYLNQRLLPRLEDDENGRPQYDYPPLSDLLDINSIEIEVDFYGDGSETFQRFYRDLEHFIDEYPQISHTYERSGPINLTATLRIGDFEYSTSLEFEIEENTAPSIDRLRFSPLDDRYGEFPSPNFLMNFRVDFYEREENQDNRIIIDWGDGNINEYERPTDRRDYRSFRARHNYELPGDYNVSVRVEDSHGASDESSIEIPVKVPVRILGYHPPQMIQPNQRNRFYATATSPYPDATIEFKFNFGHGEAQTVRVNVDQAQRGVEVFHEYPNLPVGEVIETSVSAKSLHYPMDTAIEKRRYEIPNYEPEITSGRYHLPLSNEERRELDPENAFNAGDGGGAFVQPGVVVDEERRNEVVTFFVNYHDDNGPQDALNIFWKFSDNGRTFDKRYPNFGEVQISHEFAIINENQWAEIAICDSHRACTTRRIYLNEANRRELLEDQEDLDPENIQIDGPDVDNPFGFGF